MTSTSCYERTCPPAKPSLMICTALTRYLYFDNWDHLLTFMLEGLELEIPPNSS